ncbi:MAG: hypothetical protein ABL955_02330 [Elusimicrobiota bacterium]
MRGDRIVLACMIALFCILASASEVSAGPQRDSVCQGCGNGPGCDPCPVGDGPRSYRRDPPIDWGHTFRNNWNALPRECGNAPLCYAFNGTLAVLSGVTWDAPYYLVKGVGYGLYYGGMGLGKGLYYTGRGIGRGLAYPFNRPPKPIRTPTTWEQYKHDVIKYQKRLTKTNKANKENQRWCASRVPLAASPNRGAWEARCNPGDAISRSGLPVDIMVASAVPVPVVEVAAVAIPTISPAATPIPPDPIVPGVTAASAKATEAATPTLQDPAKALAGSDAQVKTAGQGGFDNKEALMGQQSPAPQDPAAESFPQKPPITDTSLPASLSPEVPFISAETPTILSKGSAPDFPSSFGTPEQIGAVLAPDLPPATSEAYGYLSRAAGFVAKRGLDRTREVVTKTAKQAVSAEFGPAVILINMYNLPETILPKIIKMAKGNLSVEEGGLLTAEAVNVLYNFGAAPNKALAKIIEKRDAMKGVFAYGADETSDKLSVALGKGIAGLTGEMHANVRYPQIPQLKGSTAGRVDAIFHQNLKDLTTTDVRRTTVAAAKWKTEIIKASQALSVDEKTREIHEP